MNRNTALAHRTTASSDACPDSDRCSVPVESKDSSQHSSQNSAHTETRSIARVDCLIG